MTYRYIFIYFLQLISFALILNGKIGISLFCFFLLFFSLFELMHKMDSFKLEEILCTSLFSIFLGSYVYLNQKNFIPFEEISIIFVVSIFYLIKEKRRS